MGDEVKVPGREMSRVSILSAFFGKKEGQTSADFLKEIQALNEDERAELSALAARELGVVVKAA
jgi:hypothetical protein